MKVIICGAGQVGWQIARHLSGENNRPDVAEREIRDLFAKHDRKLGRLVTASQSEPTPVLEI